MNLSKMIPHQEKNKVILFDPHFLVVEVPIVPSHDDDEDPEEVFVLATC